MAFVLVVLGGLFSVISVLSGRSRSAQRIVMERWAETIGTPEDVFARYPARETNSEALELIDATVVLGVDSAPRFEEEMPRPQRSMAQRFQQFKVHSGNWLNAQLRKTSGPPDPPPEPVAAFLVEFRREIDRVHEVLLDDAKPAWMLDLTLLYNLEIPNLRGHVDLNKLLLSDSLAALGAGDLVRAERALEAAWELGELLSGDPVAITQFMRLDMKRDQAAAVRHLPWLDRWIPRMDTVALRQTMEQALFHEGWAWPQYDFSPGDEAGIMDRVSYAISGPLMRLGSADASERWRRTMLKLQGTPSWCRPALDRLGVNLDIPVPWWNKMGQIMIPKIDHTVARVAHAQLQFELTRKVLEMAATYHDSGAWPDASEPWLRSRACPTDRWVYSTEGLVASLRLGREIKATGRDVAAWQFSLDARTWR